MEASKTPDKAKREAFSKIGKPENRADQEEYLEMEDEQARKAPQQQEETERSEEKMNEGAANTPGEGGGTNPDTAAPGEGSGPGGGSQGDAGGASDGGGSTGDAGGASQGGGTGNA